MKTNYSLSLLAAGFLRSEGDDARNGAKVVTREPPGGGFRPRDFNFAALTVAPADAALEADIRNHAGQH